FAQDGLKPFVALIDDAVDVASVNFETFFAEDVRVFDFEHVLQQWTILLHIYRFAPFERHDAGVTFFFLVKYINAQLPNMAACQRQLGQEVAEIAGLPFQLYRDTIEPLGIFCEFGDQCRFRQPGKAPTVNYDPRTFRFQRLTNLSRIAQIVIPNLGYHSRDSDAAHRSA